jgi:vesicle coat complex subunit
VKSDPSLSVKGLEFIITLLSDKDRKVRYYASLSLAEIVKSDPSLAGKDLELIKTLLSDKDTYVKK